MRAGQPRAARGQVRMASTGAARTRASLFAFQCESVASGPRPWSLAHPVFARAVFAGGGLPLMAAGGGAGVITVWDLEQRKLQTVIRDAHDAPIVQLHFFPGARMCMGEPFCVFGAQQAGAAGCTGARVAAAGAHQQQTGEGSGAPQLLRCGAYSARGQRLECRQSTHTPLPARTHAPSVDHPTPPHPTNLVPAVTRAGEPLLMSAGADNALKQWVFDAADGAARLLKFRSGHAAPPTAVRHYGTDGRRLLSAGGWVPRRRGGLGEGEGEGERGERNHVYSGSAWVR